MFGIELMRLLGGGTMELDTYRMRDGSVLVLVEHDKGTDMRSRSMTRVT